MVVAFVDLKHDTKDIIIPHYWVDPKCLIYTRGFGYNFTMSRMSVEAVGDETKDLPHGVSGIDVAIHVGGALDF